MKLELVAKKNVSHVELKKDEKHHLGMIIEDGTKDEAGPVIKKVKSKSPAGRSSAVGEEDVILSFNGISTVGTKSKDAIRMIKESGNAAEFDLQYEIKEMRISPSGGVFHKQKQRKILLHKREDSFGFILRKKDLINFFEEDYPVISNIKAGSHVHRHGLMHEGDRLLKIDDVNLSCLPLRDIATLLQGKTKAEFTYQYNVGIIDFAESEEKVDLDVDVPIADLGIYLTTGYKGSALMYIENIRLGSIAERSGLFSKGDVILSIDEIDTRFLTLSKASMLLQNCKKCRKISYIPRKRKNLFPHAETMNNQGGSKTYKDSTRSHDTRRRVRNPPNTPETSSLRFSSKQEFYLQKSCFGDQTKSINNLQNIAQVIRNLKQIQGQLKGEKKSFDDAGNCTLCDESQKCSKLCLLCFANIKVACEQSIDLLQNIVSHSVVHSSTHSQGSMFGVDMKEKMSDDLRIPTEELVNALTETLPNIFSGESRLKDQFRAIAGKIIHADALCSICNLEVKSVWMAVKNLLSLLSMDYKRPDIEVSINQHLSRLLETKPCDSLYVCKCDDCCCFQAESPSDTPSVYFTGDGELTNSDDDSAAISPRFESAEKKAPDQRSLKICQRNMRKDYLKITHIQSLSTSEESGNENDLCEADMGAKSLVEDERFSLQGHHEESSSTSLKVDDVAMNRRENTYKDKFRNQTPSGFWRSLDSILKFIEAAKDQPQVPSKFSQNTSKHRVPNTSRLAQSVAGTSTDSAANCRPSNRKPTVNRAHTSSDFNDGSAPSSFTTSSQKDSQHRFRKVRTDTIEVKMTNRGKGFGLGLSMKFVPSKSSVVPVVHTIKPRSPSQRSGVLKVDDRIVAINHRSTVGLTPKELQHLKKTTFLADAVTLKVEFDVVEEELKVGTFDLVLDKTLKVGLIFEDLQRGYPMVVSGIVKGSGAHRCGQLFPGDKIKFFRCIRNEEFDPVSCNYSKEASVLVTVQRDRIEGHQKKSAASSPCYLNPCFSHKDSVPHKGSTFIVKSSNLHVIEGTDNLVLDQEVALFRDPVSWDFGFLVGENPDTGRAYVTDVRPDGPAWKSGVVKKFDRIIQVNGISVENNVGNHVLSLLSQANYRVDLMVRRLYHEDSKSV